MSIERLRALEKRFQDEARVARAAFKKGGGEYHDGRSDAFDLAAGEVHDLIAELGQEVGAVAEMPSLRCRSDACANKGQVHNHCTPRAEATPVGCIHPDTLAMFATDHKAKRVSIERWGQLRELEGYLPLYTSPAHTSEARDAERYRALKTHFQAKFHRATCDYWVIVGELKTDTRFIGEDGEQLTLDNALDAAIAAMRQDGG